MPAGRRALGFGFDFGESTTNQLSFPPGETEWVRDVEGIPGNNNTTQLYGNSVIGGNLVETQRQVWCVPAMATIRACSIGRANAIGCRTLQRHGTSR